MEALHAPWRIEYILGPKGPKDGRSIFTQIADSSDDVANYVIARGKTCYAVLNRYPYTSGHLMVVPFEHKANLEVLDSQTRAEMIELTARCMTILRKVYNPQAFNMGANIGEAAGAGVKEHVHIHIVPRWKGDTNFMSTLGDTRVLPETLEDTYQRIKKGFLSSR